MMETSSHAIDIQMSALWHVFGLYIKRLGISDLYDIYLNVNYICIFFI